MQMTARTAETRSLLQGFQHHRSDTETKSDGKGDGEK
jgi:hypothetical protein